MFFYYLISLEIAQKTQFERSTMSYFKRFLQPFMSEDDGVNLGGNDGGVAEPQPESDNLDNPDNIGANEPEPAKPAQDKEENARYAAARREAEAAKAAAEERAAALERENSIAKKYGKDYGVFSDADISREYGHLGINSLEDMDNYFEAQEKNVNPEVYSRLKQAETIAQQANEKLSKYERREKIDSEISAWKQHEVYGDFFNRWESDIKDVALKGNGDLYTSMLIVMGAKAHELKAPNVEDIKKQAVKEYIDGLRNQKPVEGGGQSPAVVQKSSNSFEDARKSALQFLRSKKE